MKKIILIFTLLIFVLQFGCSKSTELQKATDNDVFIFTSFDDASGIWTIIRDNIYDQYGQSRGRVGR